uniref:LysR substrate-binding domain-containing protein n=1 Tax=Sphingomonas bacterium TaxID=1895847 RepID=UPI0020C6FC54
AAGIADLAGDGSTSLTGRIVVGAMPLARARVLPAAIAAFHRDAPNATIDVIEGSWRELVEPLRDGVIDLTIGALREEMPPGLAQAPLLQDRLVVIGRAGHPLAGRRADVEALARQSWVVAPRGSPLRGQWESMFAGRSPSAPIECGSVMVIRGVLLDSDLLTLLSPDQVAMEIAAGLLTVIDASLAQASRIIGVTTRVDWRPTAAQARLLALLDAAASDTSGNTIDQSRNRLESGGASPLSDDDAAADSPDRPG